MRRTSTSALAVMLATGVARAQVPPPCPAVPATLTIFADNRTGAPIEVTVDGRLDDEGATCAGAGAITYPATTFTCAVGRGRCGHVVDLRPGAWIHRIAAAVPGSDPQRQAQRSVLLGGPLGDASNVIQWTLYARTFVVGEATPAAVRAAIDRATAYTACDLTRDALVTFSWDAFPGADDRTRIDLFAGESCDAGDHAACRTTALPDHCPCDPASIEDPCTLGGDVEDQVVGLCLPGDRIMVDGLDRDARPGGVILSVGACDRKLLRLYGGDTTLRGLVLEGSQAPNPNPESSDPCTLQGRQQVDTVAILGSRARRDRLEDSIVVGPSCGDAVSVQDGAGAAAGDEPGDNVIARTTLGGAADRGVKVDFGGVARVVGSCVYGNLKGGIQATRGGHLDVRENVVQRNRGGTSQNGITVIDSCSQPKCPVCADDDPECTTHRRSTLTTTGNVVRFSGSRGLAVADDATATFESDYVADNGFKGSVVETTDDVPLSGETEQAPSAAFHGVALACNHDDSESPGVGAETRRDDNAVTPHTSPEVSYGDAEHPGRNAFTSNTNPSPPPMTASKAGNFLLTNLGPPFPPAIGNQWAHCGNGLTCDLASILASDVVPADAAVEIAVEGTLEGHRAGMPEIHRITPARPRKGDVVRVYGEHFDAIEGNPTRDACSADVVACDDGACPSGPCVAGRCPCAITNEAVHDRNDLTNANHVVLRAGNTLVAEIAPDAVTPTMLAFHMPIDCYQAMTLEVDKHGSVATRSLCDYNGCLDAPPGTPCEDPYPFTGDDACDGAGSCQGQPITTSTLGTTTTTFPTTSSSTTVSQPTSSSTTTSTTATTTSTTAPPARCEPTRPATCDLDQCRRRGLHRRIARLAKRIQHRIDAGKPGKARWSNRLAKLLARCGVEVAPPRVALDG